MTVQYRGHKCKIKRATKKVRLFFASLLQNDMKSYVACFTTHIQTCLATHQVVGSCVSTVFWLDRITRESCHTRDCVTIKRSTNTCFDAKSRTTLYSVCNNFSRPDLLQDRFDPWVVKRATSLFNSFCCPFYCAFKMKLTNTITTIIRNSRPWGSQQLLGNYTVASHLQKEIFQHTRAYYTVRLLIGETVVELLQSPRLK